MPGMYPDDQIVEIFGERVKYPGLDEDTHKFTDGDFTDPLKKPSYIPAATFNLILDNMESLISALGLIPNNKDPEQLKKATLQGFAPRSIGEYHMLSYMPSVVELVRLRYLPLDYRIIKISLYEELCALKWVGAEANDTAYFWYKCTEEGTRSINGQYMRVEDARGMFYRGAGANAVLRTDMDNPLSAPYDGKNIASWQEDRIRNFPGTFGGAYYDSPGVNNAITGPFRVTNDNVVTLQGGGNPMRFYCFDPSLVVPTGTDNAPASLSALTCISY